MDRGPVPAFTFVETIKYRESDAEQLQFGAMVQRLQTAVAFYFAFSSRYSFEFREKNGDIREVNVNAFTGEAVIEHESKRRESTEKRARRKTLPKRDAITSNP